MAAYRAAAGPAAALSAPQHGGQLPPGWPARPEGVSLSYAATCYTLLHELGPVHDIFKRRPQLWEAASWAEVQRAVFGWLDALG